MREMFDRKAMRSLHKRAVAVLVAAALVMSLFVTASAEEEYTPDDVYIEAAEDDGESEDPHQQNDEETIDQDNDGEEPEAGEAGEETPGEEDESTIGEPTDEDDEQEDAQEDDATPDESVDENGESGGEGEAPETGEPGEEDPDGGDSILDVLDFVYDPQPESAEEVAALVEDFDGDFEALPKWKEMIDNSWIPAGWAQAQFEDEETGAPYWRLAPGIMAMAAPFSLPVTTFAELEDAIAAASDGDVIEIANDITFTRAVTISGVDIAITSADAGTPVTLQMDRDQTYVRHFIVNSGATLTLQDIVLDGCYDGSSTIRYGGGVENNGSLILQSGAVITGCIAIDGGGVYSSGDFKMVGGKIFENTSTYKSSSSDGGGGVYNSGTFTMEGGEIYENTVGSNNRYGYGGGVYNSGTFTMEGGKIYENTVKYATSGNGGGGVYNSSTFTMKGGEIYKNRASSTDTTGNGGGVWSDSGTYTMEGGEIYENVTGAYGGGVYSNSGTFTMKGGKIYENTGSNQGGGVYSNSSTFMMEGGEIYENTVRNYGGGVYSNSGGTFIMQNGEIFGNDARFGGGGVCSYDFTMEDGKISENTAEKGGGVYFNAEFTMKGGEISDNIATGNYGGGVYAATYNFTMKGGKIADNTVEGGSQGGGGGVYTGGNFIMEDGEISGNTVVGGGTIAGVGIGGGGAYVGGNFTMEGGKISGNTARNGGGVYIYKKGNNSVMRGGEISGNTARGIGGGLYTYAENVNGTFDMEGGEIFENTATDGGGIYVNDRVTFTMKNGKIFDNTAVGDGGGVYTSGSNSASPFIMQNGEIFGNDADNGGGFYIKNSGGFTLEGGKIFSNNATEGGGVYAYTNGGFTMKGGKIFDNTATQNGGGLYNFGGASSYSGKFIMESGEISQNAAINGGGVYTAGTNYSITMSGGEISQNHATSNGGGIYTDNLSKVKITSATAVLINNTASGLYSMTNASDIALHRTQIAIPEYSFSEGMQYAYNNYDINYTNGDPVDPSVYTVKFNAVGGTPTPPTQTVPVVGGKATLPAPEPTKDNHIFKGWYTQLIGGTEWDFDTVVTGNMVLYARWEAAPVTTNYTVTFDADGGSPTPPAQSVPNGGKAIVPTVIPSQSGYVLVEGWYTTPLTGGVKWDFDNDTVSNDITLYARWTELHTVTFDADGGSPTPPAQSVPNGGKATAPTVVPSQSGYVLVEGWYTTPLTGGVKWDFDNDTVTENITLYARWTKLHTVTFDADGGSPTPLAQSVPNGGKATKPTVIPSQSGYVLVEGWYTTPVTGGVKWDFDNDTVSNDITLYARWTELHTVTFDPTGGTMPAAELTQSVPDGQKATVPTQPTKTDHTFAGWYDAPTGGTLWDFDTLIYSDKTLYAQWTPVPVVNHTVTFDPTGGTMPAGELTQSVPDGQKATVPTQPTKADHTFAGWYDAPTSGALWNFDTLIYSDKMLYAYWTPVPVPNTDHTVTFNANGGNPNPPQQTVPHGGLATLPTEPIREHFTFGGWYHITTKWEFDNHTVDRDITLTAWWTPVTYTLSYDVNGGKTNNNLPGDSAHFYGAEVFVTNKKPERDGHTFLGWSKDSNAVTAQYTSGNKLVIEGNTILYAVWSEDIYELTYYANGGVNPPDPETDLRYNDKVTVAERGDMTYEGHTFLGWSKNAEATTTDYRPGNSITIKENTNLYAVWRNNAGYPITIEHYQYNEGDFENAVLVTGDTRTETLQYGSSFTAVPNSYEGYIYMESLSDPLTISSVTSAQTIKLYYMKADGYQIIFEGIVDGRTSLEVLDRRDPSAVPMSWNDFLAVIQPKLYLDGTEVTDSSITYSSTDYSEINFRVLTRGNPYSIAVAASWSGGTGSGSLLLDIVDTTPPDITVIYSRVTLNSGEIPKDVGYLLARAGAAVTDNYDVSVPMQVSFLNKEFGDIDWSLPGQQYAMFIDATDTSGNVAVPREVVIIVVPSGGGNGGDGGGSGGGGSNIRDNHDGSYTLLDDDDVPRGRYVPNNDGGWTFIPDEDTPLGTLPQTGDTRQTGLAIACLAAAMTAFISCRKKERNHK